MIAKLFQLKFRIEFCLAVVPSEESTAAEAIRNRMAGAACLFTQLDRAAATVDLEEHAGKTLADVLGHGVSAESHGHLGGVLAGKIGDNIYLVC